MVETEFNESFTPSGITAGQEGGHDFGRWIAEIMRLWGVMEAHESN